MHHRLPFAVAAAVSLLAAPSARAQQLAPIPLHPAASVVSTPSPGTTAIQGMTLTATGAPLPNANVRLRDVRSARVIDATTSDRDGAFRFPRVEPGAYVVELVGSDQMVLAASPLLNLNADETILTVVKLAPRNPATGLLSRGAPALITVAAASVAAGVLASTSPGQPVSPVR